MKKIIKLSLTIIILSFFVIPQINQIFLSDFFIPSASAQPVTANDPVTLSNPIPNSPTPQVLIGRVINATMGIVGSLALAMFIYGGFVWMLAAGNEQSVQKGKGILTWATIGLIVIFSSYALVSVVFTGLGVE